MMREAMVAISLYIYSYFTINITNGSYFTLNIANGSYFTLDITNVSYFTLNITKKKTRDNIYISIYIFNRYGIKYNNTKKSFKPKRVSALNNIRGLQTVQFTRDQLILGPAIEP
jgi:hypothetical protein